MKTGENLSTVRGVVIPVDWDESGNAISVAISSHDENEYHVNKDEKGKQLLALTQEEVEVSGIVREKEDKRLISVKEYSVIKDAGSRGDLFEQKPMVPEI
jgi:5S rRNA maturation endonuclease (ribonuclease M5)